MQASLSKYRGPIENCEQTPLGKSFCLGRELCEIAVTLQRAGITRVEPLEGNGWMVLVLLLWAPACKTRKASEDIFDRVFGERIGAACGWSTEYEYERHGQHEGRMRCTMYEMHFLDPLYCVVRRSSFILF
jgi:hypothetical protein